MHEDGYNWRIVGEVGSGDAEGATLSRSRATEFDFAKARSASDEVVLTLRRDGALHVADAMSPLEHNEQAIPKAPQRPQAEERKSLEASISRSSAGRCSTTWLTSCARRWSSDEQ